MPNNNEPVPAIVQGYDPRTPDWWARKAQDMGFKMYFNHDEANYTIEVRLEPFTRKARSAVDRALGDHHPDNAIQATSVYDKNSKALRAAGIIPPPREDHAKAMAVGFDDAAAYALSIAHNALQGTVEDAD